MSVIPIIYRKGNEPWLAMLVESWVKEVRGGAKVIGERLKWSAGSKHVRLVEAKHTQSGESVYGECAVAKYVALTFDALELLCASNSLHQCQIDYWSSTSGFELASSPHEPAAAADANLQARALYFCAQLNDHLRLRSFLVGHHVTLADMAAWCTLRVWRALSALTDDAVSTHFAYVKRWLQFLNRSPAFVPVGERIDAKFVVAAKGNDKGAKAGAASSSSSSGGAQLEKLKARVKLIELEGAEEGKLVTRFPPEPSGFMHLGHCKAALLNYTYALQYKGSMILRFDDTNPAKANASYEAAIIRDVARLGIKPSKVTHTSDLLDVIAEHGRRLIEQGHLYVDKSTQAEMKAQRDARQPSPYRDASVEQNLALFGEMQAGSADGLQCVVRAKMEPASDVGCLRDPAMFRCCTEPHYRVGTRYSLWPLYDFACPLIDSIEGVTHALRSNEYHERDAIYAWVLERCGVRPVVMHDFGRLSFSYTLLSKRKLAWFVDNQIVDDWDHPAFPTVQGVFRRGMTVDALRSFIVQQGSSKATVLQDSLKLWAINRQLIDPVVPRHTSVLDAERCALTVLNPPDEERAGPVAHTVAKHKKNASLGQKIVMTATRLFIDAADAALLSVGEKITLMDWGNAFVERIDSPTAIAVRLALDDTNYRKTRKLSWLADIPDLVPVRLVDFKTLISKDRLSKGDPRKGRPADAFEDYANRDLAIEQAARADLNVRSLRQGDRIQLERRGYFIVDRPYATHRPDEPAILIQIPEGKLTSMAGVVQNNKK
jgi:glutamyl/glutaminyl-tRNA synthetase